MGKLAKVMLMNPGLLRAAIATIVLVVGEALFRPALASAFFAMLDRVPIAVAPLWVAAPNLLWYGAVGGSITLLFPDRFLLAVAVAFCACALLMWQFQYPAEIWISDDVYAYVVALCPIAALPTGLVVGAYAARRLSPRGGMVNRKL
jgi:hypothetical protein